MKTLNHLFQTYPIFCWGVLNFIGSISAITMILNTVSFNN